MKLRSSISGLALAVGLGVMVAGCGQVNQVRAQKAFKDANKLYAASDWRAAATKYEEALQLNPENAYSHFFLANSLDNLYRPTRVGEPENDNLYQCGAGLAHFLIDPYGKMHVCELSRRPGWDVLDKGFLNIWNHAFPEERARKRESVSGCGSCGAFGVCSNCVGMASLESGDLVWGNTYFCEISDKRNEAVLGEERAQPKGLVRLRVTEAARAKAL